MNSDRPRPVSFGPPESDGPASGRPRGSQRPAADDTELLDAYSHAVISVVETVSPAVISVSPANVEPSSGSGSGFLISADGYALSNSHVVDGRSKMVAETADGDRVDAELVGDDPATDLALLRLASSDLPFAEFGDSAALRVGQLVIAMGSPLGLQSTVSTGIVSALGRSMRGRDGRLIENVVQHSAPINPGNSGGPLVDSRGRIVGVNTAIIPWAQGLGFAVSSNTARWVVDEFLSHGHVRRRQLGIVATTVPIPRPLVRELDLLTDQAAQVVDVVSDSPAHVAGIRPDDVIVALQGRIITGVDDIHRLMVQFPLRESLTATILRDSSVRDVEIHAAASQ